MNVGGPINKKKGMQTVEWEGEVVEDNVVDQTYGGSARMGAYMNQ